MSGNWYMMSYLLLLVPIQDLPVTIFDNYCQGDFFGLFLIFAPFGLLKYSTNEKTAVNATLCYPRP